MNTRLSELPLTFRFKKQFFSFLKPNFFKQSIVLKKKRILIARFFNEPYLNLTSLLSDEGLVHFSFTHFFTKLQSLFSSSQVNLTHVNTAPLSYTEDRLADATVYNTKFTEADIRSEVFIRRVRFRPGYQRL